MAIPFGELLEKKKMEPLYNMFLFPVTTFGYGYLEKIPAFHVPKYINRGNLRAYLTRLIGFLSVGHFESGFEELWRRIAARLDVRVNANIVAIERKDGKVLVKVDGETLAFDRAVLTCPAESILSLLDSSNDERDVLGRVRLYWYYTLAFRAKNMPDRLIVPIPLPQCGRTWLLAKLWPDSDVCLSYMFGEDRRLTEAELTAALRQDIGALGAEWTETIHCQEWHYFPHFSPDNVRAGYHDRLEDLQGNGNVYFNGGALPSRQTSRSRRTPGRWSTGISEPGEVQPMQDGRTAGSLLDRRSGVSRPGLNWLAARGTGVQLVLWVALAAAFCLSLTAMARANPYLTIVLSIGLPAVLLAANKIHFGHPRLAQLFALTSFFMLVACASIVAILSGHETINRWLAYLFFAYFAVQALGYVVDQAKKTFDPRHRLHARRRLRDLPVGHKHRRLGIGVRRGRPFQVWGEDAPLLIQAIYAVWAIRPLVELGHLPKLTELSAQMTSIVVAMLSGQLLFVRLLTASQLFLFDGVLHYASRDFISADFLRLDDSQWHRFRAVYRR